jgi:hypothetical protein
MTGIFPSTVWWWFFHPSPSFEVVWEIATQVYRDKNPTMLLLFCTLYWLLTWTELKWSLRTNIGIFAWLLEWFRFGSSARILWQEGTQVKRLKFKHKDSLSMGGGLQIKEVIQFLENFHYTNLHTKIWDL